MVRTTAELCSAERMVQDKSVYEVIEVKSHYISASRSPSDFASEQLESSSSESEITLKTGNVSQTL
jgi:hypothetical protein